MKRSASALFALLCAAILALSGTGLYVLRRLLFSEDKTIYTTDTASDNRLLYISDSDTVTLYPWNLYDSDKAVSLLTYLTDRLHESEGEEFISTSDYTKAYAVIDNAVRTHIGNVIPQRQPEDTETLLKTEITVIEDWMFMNGAPYTAAKGVSYTAYAVLNLRTDELLYLHCVPASPPTTDMETVEQMKTKWQYTVDLLRMGEKQLKPESLTTLITELLRDESMILGEEKWPFYAQEIPTPPAEYSEVEADKYGLNITTVRTLLKSLVSLGQDIQNTDALENCLFYGDMQVMYYQSELLATFRFESSELTLYIGPMEEVITGFSLCEDTQTKLF